jgi:hypothetical protein
VPVVGHGPSAVSGGGQYLIDIDKGIGDNIHMRQSATVLNTCTSQLHLSSYHFENRWILYQFTCDPKNMVKYCNPNEYRGGEIFWWNNNIYMRQSATVLKACSSQLRFSTLWFGHR